VEEPGDQVSSVLEQEPMPKFNYVSGSKETSRQNNHMVRKLNLIRENSNLNTVKIHRESSSTGGSVKAQLRQSNKEKLHNMREIKKYLDNIFKDLKEASQQVQVMQANNLRVPIELSENFNKHVKKTFHRVQLNIF